MPDSGNKRLVLCDPVVDTVDEPVWNGVSDSNVVQFPSSAISSLTDEVRTRIDLWRKYDQHIDAIFKRMDAMGIDTRPLNNRTLKLDRDLERIEIIMNITEYLRAILKAYDAIVEKGVSVISVHEQKSVSEAAIEFVKKYRNCFNKDDFERLLIDVRAEETTSSSLRDYMDALPY